MIAYLVVAFGLSWLVWGLLALPALSGIPPIVSQMIVSVTMWVPAFGVLIAKKVTKREKILSASLRPRFRGNIPWYLAAWFLPAVFTLLGAALYFLIFPGQFDSSFTIFFQLLQPSVDAGIVTEAMLPFIGLIQMGIILLTAPFINMLFALGEEIGWRGFLYPELEKRMSPIKASLVSGVVWGLWHTPINMMGHNYGVGYWGYPWLGIVAMCLFCIGIGCFLSYLTMKTGSIWPAALGHGAVNAAAGLPVYGLVPGVEFSQVLGPMSSGLIACLPMLAFGLLCAVGMAKTKKTT